MDQKTREYLRAPARLREIGLERAKLVGEMLNDVIHKDVWNSYMASEDTVGLETFKRRIVEDLVAHAETQYEAMVRQNAMFLMESHHELTAEKAMTFVEESMLEALFDV